MRQEAGGRILREEQPPKPGPGGFMGGGAQHGVEGPLLPPGPPGVVLMPLGPCPP